MDVAVLVIDDDVVTNELRKNRYEELCVALNKKSTLFTFSMLFAKSGVNAIEIMKLEKVDFVLLDLVLAQEWLDGVPFEALVKHVGNTSPFAIVTSKFDISNREQTAIAVADHGFTLIFKWNDLGDPDAISFIFMAIIVTARRLKNLESGVLLDGNESIYILYLSDIQFGGFDTTHVPVEIQVIATKVRQICGRHGPTFVAVTGDFAETATPQEFDGAFRWLESLLSRIGIKELPSSRVFVVPGNHDVSLALATSGNLRWNEATELVELSDEVHNERLKGLGLLCYSNFSKRISKGCMELETSIDNEFALGWLNDALAHLGVVFYGLNTTTPLVPCTKPRQEVRGEELGDLAKKLTAVRNDWVNNYNSPEPFVIGMSHHSLIGDVRRRSIENPDLAQSFLGDNPTQLLLHGHVHKSDADARSFRNAKTFVRSCASTITKPSKARPEDSNRGFNIIELVRKEGAVQEIVVSLIEWRDFKLDEGKDKSRFVKATNGGFNSIN